MERETGIEPATNSLEGCDSTTELLPPSSSACRASLRSSARQAPPFNSLRSRHLPPLRRLRSSQTARIDYPTSSLRKPVPPPQRGANRRPPPDKQDHHF